MDFVKVIIQKTDERGNAIKSNQGLNFEALIPVSKIDLVIEPKSGGLEVVFNKRFLLENNIKVNQVLTDLRKLPQWADRIE